VTDSISARLRRRAEAEEVMKYDPANGVALADAGLLLVAAIAVYLA
jgi:hypothetical protein